MRLGKTGFALVLLAALAGSLASCAPARGGRAPELHPPLPVASLRGPRLLVIAPHPDDETVGAGSAIATARAKGWTVDAVFATCGDGFIQAVRRRSDPHPGALQMQAFGKRRVAEARQAISELGMPEKDAIFLGFPDGSMHFLWQTNYSGPPALGRNGAKAVPYRFAYRVKAPYTGAQFESELEQIIRDFKPTTVIFPDAADVHRDHWAVGAFTQAALLRTGYQGLALTYLVHRADFPSRSGNEIDQPIQPPEALINANTTWLTMPVGYGSREAQQRALDVYGSQLRSDGPLVRSFIRPNALFGEPIVARLTTATLSLPEGRQDPSNPGALPAGTVASLTLSPTASGITLGVMTKAPVSTGVTYELHARAFGPGTSMRFYDARVAGERFSAYRTAEQSVDASGSLVSLGGDRIEVALPPELTSGAEWLMVGADTYSDHMTADHAPWRLVKLAR